MIVNSGRIQADISGSVNSVPIQPTKALYTNLNTQTRNSAGTTTYTVPASKIAIIQFYSVPAGAQVAQANSLTATIGGNTWNIAGVTAASTVGISSPCTIKMTTGDTLTINNFGGFTYYEIDA